jgi:hypothetical protein
MSILNNKVREIGPLAKTVVSRTTSIHRGNTFRKASSNIYGTMSQIACPHSLAWAINEQFILVKATFNSNLASDDNWM